MDQKRAYHAYQMAEAETSGRGKLIVMLYDGIHRFSERALAAIREGDFEKAHHNLTRIGRILLELLGTLKEGGEGGIASNLKRIYVYCYEQIVVANLKKDEKRIREVQGILANLGEAWREIGGRYRSSVPESSLKRIRTTG